MMYCEARANFQGSWAILCAVFVNSFTSLSDISFLGKGTVGLGPGTFSAPVARWTTGIWLRLVELK
eukprot:2370-Pyramimonas_sp.AAC.2